MSCPSFFGQFWKNWLKFLFSFFIGGNRGFFHECFIICREFWKHLIETSVNSREIDLKFHWRKRRHLDHVLTSFFPLRSSKTSAHTREEVSSVKDFFCRLLQKMWDYFWTTGLEIGECRSKMKNLVVYLNERGI